MDRKTNPVEWALFMHQLQDAREHLDRLTQELDDAGRFGEEDLYIQLGHIYAHLNRAWHSRNHVGDVTDNLFRQFSRLPDDLDPC
jgi:hypothetical protein